MHEDGGKLSVYRAKEPHFGGIISRYLTCNDHEPLPHTGSFNCPNWLGGGPVREVKGENCQGGRGRVGGGKVKGQLSLRPVGTLVVRERMKKTPAVQSGRAMPMGKCASPPHPPPLVWREIFLVVFRVSYGSLPLCFSF